MRLEALVTAFMTASMTALVSTGLVVSPPLPATAVTTPRTSASIPLHECAGAAVRCDGTVAVPLDWGNPASERIEVAFAWVPAAKEATGTILANPGGPLPALPDVPRLTRTLGPVLDRMNLLVVDPRGLGESSPLLCPGLKLTEPESVAACAAHLGPRIRFFTADQAVQDMDAVRRALGAGPVTFYGTSYGTAYAQAYAARRPEGLAAAFLDSATITGPDGHVLWPTRFLPERLGFVCGRSRACRELPGDPERTHARLVTHLRAHPDPEVPPPALMSMGRMTEPVFGREVNAAATAYLSGDPAPLRRLASVLNGVPSQPIEGAEWAGYLAYRCGDGSFPFNRDAGPAERQAQLERYFARERPLAPFTLADLGLDARSGLESCVNWPTPRPAPVLPPHADLPAVPVLVAGGDFDTHTPAEVARAMRVFPGATFVRVPFGTHSLAWGPGAAGECVLAMLRSFVLDHRVPRTRCDAENYRASGAFPRSLGELAPLPAPGLDVERRRVLAAGYATAADAVARRNPYNLVHGRLTEQAGLRGGKVTFGSGLIELDEAAFVPGVTVTGRVTLRPEGKATASLTVSPGTSDGGAEGRVHRVELVWEAFTARERPALSGSFDGTPVKVPEPA
ncbi:alpha/beta fold hydrolase [Nonomuraea sp. NPDC048882]|uniref:alpha/beta fold hydrolase n=1 Tax=Nonomuraea sp. NPDC048882 TaxID=3154347 RepID=UPI0033E2BC1D